MLKKDYVLFCCLVFLSINIKGQKIQSYRNIDSAQYIHKLDSLNLKFGKNKKFPESLKLSCFIAISHFPELSNQKIFFKNSKIKTTLNARPAFMSLFHFNKSKRKYIIRVNCSKRTDVISVNHVHFNGKIGLLGHEFAHIIDYQHKSFLGVIKRAISYLSAESKSKFEHEIDSLTINRGLGWQLYDWSYFVLNQSNATEKYKIFKEKTYMIPREILTLMHENGFSTHAN